MEDWRRRYPCPIWHNDFLQSPDVVTMSHQEIGIYTLLLLWQWESSGCILKDDDKFLEVITRVNSEQERVALRGVLERCFTRNSEGVFNKVMLHQYEEKKAYHQVAVESGKRGGRKPKKMPKGTPKPPRRVKKPSPPPSPSPPKKRYSSEFEQFWSVYPRKIGKADALAAWKKSENERPDVSVLIETVRAVQGAGGFADKEYIPYPSTWLRGRRWEDNAADIASAPKGPIVGPIDAGEW